MMDVQTYLERRRQLAAQEPKFRVLCNTCLQPEFTCYCPHIRPFDPGIRFLILIHPIEMRRRIATGRMTHLCLRQSRLIHGYNYTHNAVVNAAIEDPENHCVVLYPGRQSRNLTPLSPAERADLVPKGKRLVVIAMDGTWSTARKMLNRSRNLLALPQICFTPPTPSNFRVRQQPKPECYSTLEAIHHVIELTGPIEGFDVAQRTHDNLLYVFDKMVTQQLGFIAKTHKWRRRSRHDKSSQVHGDI